MIVGLFVAAVTWSLCILVLGMRIPPVSVLEGITYLAAGLDFSAIPYQILRGTPKGRKATPAFDFVRKAIYPILTVALSGGSLSKERCFDKEA